MAFIIKGEGAEDPRLHDPRYSLSYEELAQLHRAAKAGNSAAAIRLAQLPATEKRLAAQVDKAFGSKPGTKKVSKSRCVLCGRKQCGCAGPTPAITKAEQERRDLLIKSLATERTAADYRPSRYSPDPVQRQRPASAPTDQVVASIRRDFVHSRHLGQAFDPGADDAYQRALGPDDMRDYQADRLARDPLRAVVARRYGIALDDLAPRGVQ